MLAPVQPPFTHWPIQYKDASFGYAWWCEGGMIVTQLGIDVGSEAGAFAYHHFERTMLERHREELKRVGGLYVIHDWRSMERHESAARTYWQDQMRQRPKGYLRGSTVVVSKVATLVKMAVQAANLVSSLTGNGSVEITSDLDAVLKRQHPTPCPKLVGGAGVQL